ncbi:MAG: FAD-binding oxidoreductase [SAR324 cluster bacterium]|nr:FAD-binding oxidoreductase [SAR324 cluster bacterium]
METVEMTSLNGGTSTVPAQAASQLQAALRGRMILSGEADYDQARAIWNGMIDRRPAIIVRPAGVADVAAAVTFAREHDLLLSVRGGGHNIAGTSLCDGGITIDFTAMKGVHVNPRGDTVRVQPGCALGDVDREAQHFGLAVPGGYISTTGVAGLTLGGGFGWLSRKYGYTCDNLLSVDLVTADGRSVTADAEQNADLFWGVRGGGGNFGVVTSFEYRAHPVGPTVVAGMILYPMDAARDVIRFYRDFTAQAPEELVCMLMLRTAPAAPFLPEEVHGVPVVGIIATHCGPVAEAERVLRPLKAFGKPLVDMIEPKPFAAHQCAFDATQPAGRRYYWKSEYFSELSDGATTALLDGAARFTSPDSIVAMMSLGGAASRIGEEDTAAGGRDAAYIAVVNAGWDDAGEDERNVAWARETWQALREHATGGVYVNFIPADEGEERVREAYGQSKYERLIALKNQYDPTNLFRVNQNIRPTAKD